MLRTLITIIILTSSIQLATAQSDNGFMHYEPIPFHLPQALSVPQFQPQIFIPRRRPQPNQTDVVEPQVSLLSAFIIKVATINGHDFSQHYINSHSGIIFYKIEDQPVEFMTIAMTSEHSQSFGKMLALTQSETPAIGTEYGKTTMIYSWAYLNSADDKEGSATVTFIQEYRNDGTYFKCEILAPDTKIVFEGVMAP